MAQCTPKTSDQGVPIRPSAVAQGNDQRTPRNVAQGVRADHHAVSHPNSSCDERFQARAAVAVASIRVGDSQLGGFGASDEFPKWFGSLCI